MKFHHMTTSGRFTEEDALRDGDWAHPRNTITHTGPGGVAKSAKSTRKGKTHHTVVGRRRSFQTLEMNQQGYAIAKGVHKFMHEPCYA